MPIYRLVRLAVLAALALPSFAKPVAVDGDIERRDYGYYPPPQSKPTYQSTQPGHPYATTFTGKHGETVVSSNGVLIIGGTKTVTLSTIKSSVFVTDGITVTIPHSGKPTSHAGTHTTATSTRKQSSKAGSPPTTKTIHSSPPKNTHSSKTKDVVNPPSTNTRGSTPSGTKSSVRPATTTNTTKQLPSNTQKSVIPPGTKTGTSNPVSGTVKTQTSNTGTATGKNPPSGTSSRSLPGTNTDAAPSDTSKTQSASISGPTSLVSGTGKPVSSGTGTSLGNGPPASGSVTGAPPSGTNSGNQNPSGTGNGGSTSDKQTGTRNNGSSGTNTNSVPSGTQTSATNLPPPVSSNNPPLSGTGSSSPSSGNVFPTTGTGTGVPSGTETGGVSPPLGTTSTITPASDNSIASSNTETGTINLPATDTNNPPPGGTKTSPSNSETSLPSSDTGIIVPSTGTDITGPSSTGTETQSPPPPLGTVTSSTDSIVLPPPSGTNSTPPPGTDNAVPPNTGTDTANPPPPSSTNTDSPPSAGTGTENPPPATNTNSPPPVTSTENPPPPASTENPPSGSSINSPPPGGTINPPPPGGTINPPPPGGTINPPPPGGDDNNPPPPPGGNSSPSPTTTPPPPETTTSCTTSISATWESVICTVTASVTTGTPACTTRAYTTVVSCSEVTASTTTTTTTITPKTYPTKGCGLKTCGNQCPRSGNSKRASSLFKRADARDSDPPSCKWADPENYKEEGDQRKRFLANEAYIAKYQLKGANNVMVSLPERELVTVNGEDDFVGEERTSSQMMPFADKPVSISTPRLVGCTSIIVVSRKGAWVNHIWEFTTFRPEYYYPPPGSDDGEDDGEPTGWLMPGFDSKRPHTDNLESSSFPYADQLSWFRVHALKTLHAPYDDNPPHPDNHKYGLDSLKEAGGIFDDVNNLRIFIFAPYVVPESEDDGNWNNENPTNLAAAWDRDGFPTPRADEGTDDFNTQILKELQAIFGANVRTDRILYAPDQLDFEDGDYVSNRGRAMVQYQPGNCESQAQWRIWFENQQTPFAADTWDPIVGDDSTQYCSLQNSQAPLPNNNKLRARQACSPSSPTTSVTPTSTATAVPMTCQSNKDCQSMVCENGQAPVCGIPGIDLGIVSHLCRCAAVPTGQPPSASTDAPPAPTTSTAPKVECSTPNDCKDWHVTCPGLSNGVICLASKGTTGSDGTVTLGPSYCACQSDVDPSATENPAPIPTVDIPKVECSTPNDCKDWPRECTGLNNNVICLASKGTTGPDGTVTIGPAYCACRSDVIGN